MPSLSRRHSNHDCKVRRHQGLNTDSFSVWDACESLAAVDRAVSALGRHDATLDGQAPERSSSRSQIESQSAPPFGFCTICSFIVIQASPLNRVRACQILPRLNRNDGCKVAGN